MNKMQLKTFLSACAIGLSLCGLQACREETGISAPSIESVWTNMSTQPIEQVACAYPGQTISLRGSGFSGVSVLDVNGMEIDLTETQIYNTDASIIIALPSDVATTTDTGNAYLKVTNSAGEAVYEPFYVKSTSEKPTISSFSNTVLTAGSTLRIGGSNLGGATEVYLPLAYDQKVQCAFDTTQTSSSTELYIIVPDSVNFAQGQVEVVMTKTYEATGDEYVEKAYSDQTNFSN